MFSSVAKNFATTCSHRPNVRAMSTVRYTGFGHPSEVIKVVEDDKDAPLKGGEVAVKFLAAPINVADLTQIQGAYGIKPTSFPAVAGNEGVAVVTAVGPNVSKLKVNDRVVPAIAGFGTWRSKAVAKSEDDLIKVSSDIKVEDAATLTVNPATAYRLLSDFESLKEGDVVIQNAANSAVGQSVIQLAALKGIKTINIVREDGDYEYTNNHLKSLGATIVVADHYVGSAKFKSLIADLPKPKLALNCVGGQTTLEMTKILEKNGTLVTYGGMSKEPVMVGTGSLIFQNISLKGFWLSEWSKTAGKAEKEAMLKELAGLVKSGKLRSWIETYKFSQVEDALDAALNRTTKRKIVMLMDQ